MRTSRRRLLAAVPAAVAGMALAGCGVDTDEPVVGLAAQGPSLWKIPDAAWQRALGNHPPGATGTVVPRPTGRPPGAGAPRSPAAPVSRTKRGIPVGGIGTGSFMFNLCGSFGPWHLDPGGDDSLGSVWGSPVNSGFEQRFLAGAAFHVRLATAGGTVVQTLATEDVLPAWTGLETGSGIYSALFPKAWFEYDDLPVPVALKQVTPFVARDERRSSLPAGLFQLAVSNPTATPVTVTCMLSFPNAPYRLSTEQYQYTRVGLRSSSVRAGDIAGVRLQAQDKANAPQTQRSEWVIAARGPAGARLSTTEDWAADGDGTDLWQAFSSGGLPDGPLDQRRLALGGAVASSFVLAPGERRVASFALSFDFPVVQFPNPVSGTRWWKRYTQWYPGPYRAWSIAQDVLSDSAGLEEAIDDWWTRVTDDDAYPLWLRCAALNELYYDVFGGVFWENGCITKKKVYGNRPGQHLYFTMESDSLRDCESFDVRHYEARHLLQLFPTIEHDLLLGWADLITADPAGRTPHDAGSPVDDPWFVVNQYSATARRQAPDAVDWLDLPAKFVQQAHAYWRYTGDQAFATEVYPAATKTMDHLLGLDLDGDGIPDAQGLCTTYDDIVMEGAAIYVATLTIGACEAMADFAASLDTPEVVAHWKAAAAHARTTAEGALWVAGEGYYRLDSAGPSGSALLADALCGQRYAARDGLPDALDASRMASHLSQAFRRNVMAFSDGQFGAVNAVEPSGSPAAGRQARAVWPGGTYFVAALMHAVGLAVGQGDLVAAGLTTGFGVYRTTYADDRTAFWFDTPARWDPGFPLHYGDVQYQRARGAWELLVAVKDPFPSGWAP